MGKEDEKKVDTGFGFKDKAKALETLVLLEKEPTSYQNLTVRGLLGRAKRTLKMTKDSEKIKNISQAIEVFEEWINNKKSDGSSNKKKSEEKKTSDDDDDKSNKKNKSKDKDEPADTVPGLGFKDKDKALETIQLLEGRDPDYQKLAVKGLVGRAKRVLTCTKDKEKLQNIKDAMDVFEKFLDEFDKTNMSKQNMSYLPLSAIDNCLELAKYYDIISFDAKRFLDAYRSVDGQYKKLRTIEDKESNLTWDIVRNKELKALRLKLDDPDLFEDDGNPTKEHLLMILWAYSPQEHRTKKLKIVPWEKEEDEEESMNGDNITNERKRKYSTSSDEIDSSKKKK